MTDGRTVTVLTAQIPIEFQLRSSSALICVKAGLLHRLQDFTNFRLQEIRHEATSDLRRSSRYYRNDAGGSGDFANRWQRTGQSPGCQRS